MIGCRCKRHYPTEETRDKWRQAQQRLDKSYLTKYNEILWKNPNDPRRDKLVKRNCSEEQRRAVSRALTGRPKPIGFSERMREIATGRKYPPEVIEKFSQRSKKHMEKNLLECQCYGHQSRRHQQGKSPTDIENILYDLVLREFPEIRKQEIFGRYTVDAYLPAPYHLAFEADGSHWHRDSEFDRNRDSYLLNEFNLPVIRFSDKELYAMERS